MLLLANFIVVCMMLFIICKLIDHYNQIVFDEFRFKYFALRDKLAMLVANGDLKEDSWEYQDIVDVLNFHIKTTETMSIGKVVSALIEYHTSSKERKTVRMLKKETDHQEVIEIMIEFFAVTLKLMEKNDRAQLWLGRKFVNIAETPRGIGLRKRKRAVTNLHAYQNLLGERIEARTAV